MSIQLARWRAGLQEKAPIRVPLIFDILLTGTPQSPGKSILIAQKRVFKCLEAVLECQQRACLEWGGGGGKLERKRCKF